MGPGAGQDATTMRAPMLGRSPQVRVAFEPPRDEIPYPSSEQWREAEMARWRDIFAVPELTLTGGSTTSALDAVAELLGHMFNEIWLE
jgi:hypothetical protein